MARWHVVILWFLLAGSTLAAGPQSGMWMVAEDQPQFEGSMAAASGSGNSMIGVSKDGKVQFALFDKVTSLGLVDGGAQLVASDAQGGGAAIIAPQGEIYLVKPGDANLRALNGKLANAAEAIVFDAGGFPVVLNSRGEVSFVQDDSLSVPVPTNLASPRILLPPGQFLAGMAPTKGLVVKATSQNQAIVFEIPTSISTPAALGASRDGRLLLVADSESSLVEVWDLASRRRTASVTVPGAAKVRLGLAEMFDGVIVSVDSAGTARFTDLATGESISHDTYVSADNPATSKTLSIESGAVTSIGRDGKVKRLTLNQAAAYSGSPEFVEVPVHYATNRAKTGPATFFGGCLKFFASWFGIFATIIAVAVVLVAFIVFVRRQQGYYAVATLAGFAGPLVLAAMYSIDLMWRFEPDRKDRYGDRLDELQYGVARVTVPLHRKIGEFNTPDSIWIYHETPDPSEHILLKSLEEVSESDFQNLVGAQADEAAKDTNNSADDALLFIHGYNVRFDDAVRSTAQLAADLKFAGPAICFSWPSYGETPAYFWDVTNADNSVPDLQKVLNQLNANSKIRRIHVIAHSMGNRVLTQALIHSGAPKLNGQVFRQVVLAAPDVDAVLFKTQLAPKLAALPQHITLYASSNDVALSVSKSANGGQRAGDSSPMTVCPKIDCIDASDVDTTFVGHSYISGQRSVIDDLFYLLGSEVYPPARFAMSQRSVGPDTYWQLHP